MSTGKMVLVEVSYAPPVPEKARIAYEMGAAGIMCMNWGNDEEVICRRGLKGVWGNPTEANFHCIPEIVGVGVTRGAGLKLKQLCSGGAKKVEVKVTAIAGPHLEHRPPAHSDPATAMAAAMNFCWSAPTLDAWKPGVTCNATGNATTLEICRILSKHRQELDRDVYFVFWDGHEVAEAAGSTWFVDNNWDNLNKHCVCYMHIDSTGVKETELYEIKASGGVARLCQEEHQRRSSLSWSCAPWHSRKSAIRVLWASAFPPLRRGSPSPKNIWSTRTARHSGGGTTPSRTGRTNAIPAALEEDTQSNAQGPVYDLATAKILPYDFSDKLSAFHTNVKKIADKFGDHMDFIDLQDNLQTVERQVAEIQSMADDLSERASKAL